MDNDYYLKRATVRDQNTFYNLERNHGLKPMKWFIFGLVICAIITVFV